MISEAHSGMFISHGFSLKIPWRLYGHLTYISAKQTHLSPLLTHLT